MDMRVVIADDNPLIREGLRIALESLEVEVVGSAGDGREAVAMISDVEPDMAFVDVRMPELDGLEVVDAIGTSVPCVMLTNDDHPETVREAAVRGAAGYLVHGDFVLQDLKIAAELACSGRNFLSPTAAGGALAALRRQAGPTDEQLRSLYWLTPREIDVLRLVADGLANDDIASALQLSIKTVKNNLSRVFFKMRVKSRAEATAAFHRGESSR